jgi:hypothetical protein
MLIAHRLNVVRECNIRRKSWIFMQNYSQIEAYGLPILSDAISSWPSPLVTTV